MTDLTQALAELRQMELAYGQLWTAREVAKTQNADNCKIIATILNAALSGDLIPRADADLAVALMVEKAGVARSVWIQFSPMGEAENVSDEPLARHYQWVSFEALRALVPASALAELQALRDELTRLQADMTTYQKIVSDMTQEAEAAEAELATLRAQVERLTDDRYQLAVVLDEVLVAFAKCVGKRRSEHWPTLRKGHNLLAEMDNPHMTEVEKAAARAALTEGAAP